MLCRSSELLAAVVVVGWLSSGSTGQAEKPAKPPLKVFVLAGQSNMVGAAKVSTIGYIGEDANTLPMLKEMVDGDGKPRMIKDTWISYYQANQAGDPKGEGLGQLTAGYGGRRNPQEDGGKIGPELTFGIYMQKSLKQPILIIKTAWGGKSLHTDFRPPSAGPYRLNEGELKAIKKRGKNPSEEQAKRARQSGVYYRLMMGHIRHVLKDIKRVYPGYEESQGYEIAGFVWFQGWNDLVARSVYPNRGREGGYDKYSEVLAMFIRDVRRDLKKPKLPFVIGVMGVNGPIDNVSPRYREIHRSFRNAMAAPAGRPEFRGNVLAVRTAAYWDMKIERILQKQELYKQRKRAFQNKVKKKEITQAQAAQEEKKLEAFAITPEQAAVLKRGKSNAAYHYNGCAKTMALIGKAFAEATLRLQMD